MTITELFITRSWFYFGIRGWQPDRVIKISVMNMNRQGKLFSQGHAPVTRILPGMPVWERIGDKPSCEVISALFQSILFTMVASCSLSHFVTVFC